MGYPVIIALLLGFGAGALAQERGEVQPAVLWERARNAAAKPVHSSGPAETKPAMVSKPGDGNETDALRWERAKDRAVKRQMENEHTAQSRTANAKTKK
jgi:hypothetical protein